MNAPDDKRSAAVELEVPGTPEEVWEAVATGPGITSWFVPTEVDGRVGGHVRFQLGPELESTAELVAYDPPRRLVMEEEWRPAPDASTEQIATEFLVEARGGGTCVVRVVTSGFGSGSDWDRPVESVGEGWRSALETLRLTLTHFRGRRCAPILTGGNLVEGPRQRAGAQLLRELGIVSTRPGERVDSAPGAPELAGEVAFAEAGHVLLLVERPARGIVFLAAGSATEDVMVFMRAYLFGEGADAVAAREAPRWQAWIDEHFPARAGSVG